MDRQHSNQEDKQRKALVLLSGGQDSTTCLLWALRSRYSEVGCIIFDYGQRHRNEIRQAELIAKKLGVKKFIVHLLIPALGSALQNITEPLKSDGGFHGLPTSFLPGRNMIFLSYATAMAAVSGYDSVIIGVNAIDFSGYPDCRPGFITAFQAACQEALDVNIKIVTPLIDLNKVEIWEKAAKYLSLQDFTEIIIRDTRTCYDGDERIPHDWGYGCGLCPACNIRRNSYVKFMEKKGK